MSRSGIKLLLTPGCFLSSKPLLLTTDRCILSVALRELDMFVVDHADGHSALSSRRIPGMQAQMMLASISMIDQSPASTYSPANCQLEMKAKNRPEPMYK